MLAERVELRFMWKPPFLVSIVTLLLVGCQTRDRSAITTLPPTRNPLRVTGALAPRAGLTIPQGATFELVFRRTDFEHGIIAIIPLRTTGEWPARFDVSIQWPNVPHEGEEVDWKASPPILSIFARGSATGRAAFISEPWEYTVNDSMNGRFVNLVIRSIME